MAQTISGADFAVSVLNRAFNNTSPSNAVFSNQVATAGTTEASQYAFATNFAKGFANLSDAALATQVLTNMGVLPSTEASVQALEGALADYFATVSKADRGIVVLQLGQILSGLETATGEMAVYAPAAKAWNVEVERAYVYSFNVQHDTPQQGDGGAGTTALKRTTDVLSGSAFTGYLDYNQFTGNDEQTLTTGDRLTGTAGDTDTLFAQQVVGSRPTLSGIEVVSIDAKGPFPNLDLSDSTGIKKVINYRSSETSALTFSGLKNLVDVEVDHTNANTVVTFNGSVVAGLNDSLNLSVKAAGVAAKAADIFLGGVENLSIAATEGASVLGNVVEGNLQKLTITGDQNLNVGTKVLGGFSSVNLTTVDGSAATGNLFLNIVASAGRDQTVTTGKGNDVIVTGTLSATDTFNLGEGNDRVVLVTANSNQAAKLQGVEEVEARVAGTNLNLTNAPDVKLLAVAEGAGFANVTAVKSGTTVAFEGVGVANGVSNAAPAFGAVTYNLANASGPSDVMNFKFSNNGIALGANSTVSIGTLTNTGNNTETMNFAFSDVVATTTVTVSDIAGNTTALKNLNITSDSKVTMGGVNDLLKLTSVDATGVKAGLTATFGNLGDAAAATIKLGGSGVNSVSVGKADDGSATAVKLLTVDGSAGTGNQSLTITANADVTSNPAAVISGTTATAKASVSVIGGSGNDTIAVTSVAGAVNLISGGAGSDTINLAASAGVDVIRLAAGDASGSLRDTINGFTLGTDKIDLSAFGFDAALHGVTSVAAAMTGTGPEFAGNAVYVDTAANTLYVDVNGDNKFDAADLVVNVTGVTVTAADILFV